jgi:hypothetical protein
MVDPELGLESVDRRALRHRHQAGVVDQDVDHGVCRDDRVGGFVDRREVGQVERNDLERCIGAERGDRVDGVVRLVDVAGSDHHVGVGERQRLARLEAQAAVAAGHDRDLVGEVGYVVGRPGLHRASLLHRCFGQSNTVREGVSMRYVRSERRDERGDTCESV